MSEYIEKSGVEKDARWLELYKGYSGQSFTDVKLAGFAMLQLQIDMLTANIRTYDAFIDKYDKEKSIRPLTIFSEK